MPSRNGNSREVSRIADQFRHVCKGGAWFGSSLNEVLSGVDEDIARRRPMEHAHTIWELVLHVTSWIRIARECLAAAEIRGHTAEENWPPITGSWQHTLAILEREVDALEQAILAFSHERLDDDAPAPEPQTYYILLHGVIQHVAYHAGQIAVLQK